MAVLIKRFRVRYNGVVYGPGQPGGQILAGLSEEEEARLIAGSNGAIEAYVSIQVPENEPSGNDAGGEDPPADDEVVGGDAAGPGADREDGEGDAAPSEEELALPTVDPTELIKPKNGKRR